MREFRSIKDFVRFLELLAPQVEIASQLGLHEGARMIQEEAQASLGHYQDSAGPFPAWPALAETTLQGYTDAHGHHHPGKIEMGFAPPDNPLQRTDELHDHVELSVTHNHAVVGVPDEVVGDGTEENPTRNIGQVAAWLEFGDREMPARSFLGRAAFVKGHAVANAIGHAVYLALSGKPYVPLPRHEADDIPF